MMRFILPLEDPRALDADVCGRKFAALARAAQAGFAVPPAAVVSTRAHAFFMAHRRWPEGLWEEILATARHLDLPRGLAVRSSATHEDLEQQSFAGQYRSFLSVVAEADLKAKIELCWQSAASETVGSYRQARNLTGPPPPAPLMGVVLQRMVPATAAGVAFGRNPIRPSREEIVIEGIQGLADHLVDGHLSPHRAFLERGGTLRMEPPPTCPGSRARPRSPLTDHQWRQVGGLLQDLEKATGQKPLDIEWAVDPAQTLWLLQYRKITTLPAEDPAAPPGVWTRRIADDLWADRLTPLLAGAMIRNAPRYTLTRTLKILGFGEIRPSLAVIDGYLYVNCDGLRQAVACLPAGFRSTDLRNLFPAVYDFEGIPAPRPAQLAALLTRGLALLVREPMANPLVCLGRSPGIQQRLALRIAGAEAIPAATADQSLKRLRYALETLARIQMHNQWPYAHAALWTLLLRWLVVDRAGMPHAEFLRLISAGGANVTLTIERRFREMAGGIARDPLLRGRFAAESPGQLLANMPAALRADFEAFLKRYGFRSRHRTLCVKRWREAPEEVLAILQALVRQPAAGKNLTAPLSGNLGRPGTPRGLLRAMLPLLLPLVRRFLDLRENLRFLLDRALYAIRRAALALGDRTGLGEMVLFLDLQELQRLVDGRLALTEARALADERQRAFGRPAEIPSFFIDGQPIDDFSLHTDVLRGIGTSPGRATGRARIVVDPARAAIQQGDILVAANTDPGWTPILSMVSGLVMEEGGLLNHCSIVARELKIPAIVGVRRATRRIPEGSRITVDGGLGLVRIETHP